MANTFSKIYIQLVLTVKGRQSLINPQWEKDLYKYITGIVQNKGQKMLAINGMPDHLHLFIGMNPDCNLSDLVREIKKSTNVWINTNGLTPSKFYWQIGFGAFSYAESEKSRVIRYIENQKEHHSKKSFQAEFMALLEKFEVPYKKEYLFEWQ
ncbi:MAG: IS200/IS605 family transposase [Bacteroidia bacterium]|nr:IS200/IS605 family transposase [Bacteroidia bacterium]